MLDGWLGSRQVAKFNQDTRLRASLSKIGHQHERPERPITRDARRRLSAAPAVPVGTPPDELCTDTYHDNIDPRGQPNLGPLPDSIITHTHPLAVAPSLLFWVAARLGPVQWPFTPELVGHPPAAQLPRSLSHASSLKSSPLHILFHLIIFGGCEKSILEGGRGLLASPAPPHQTPRLPAGPKVKSRTREPAPPCRVLLLHG